MNRPDQLHRLADDSPLAVRWIDDSPLAGRYPTASGTIRVAHGVFTSGKSEGVQVVWVDTGAAQTILLPSRGMGLWRITAAGIDYGWASPVDGPVHPSLVPVQSADGLGWLEGFDELLVRCGLESNGAPEHDPQGTLRYPLHGRIANLPASGLRVEVDVATGHVAIVGDVIESQLFFKRLRLRSRAIFTAGATAVELVDELTNELSVDASAQLLYHINLGRPLLTEGAEVVAPIQRLAPKDDAAAEQIDRWNRVGPPRSGDAERVYFAQLHADDDGNSAAMLRRADGTAGLGVHFDTRTLPYFILWKNTAAVSDGYVVGLEPATNLPNGRSIEAQRGRLVDLPSGQTVTFRLGIEPLVDADRVTAFQQRIDALSPPTSPDVARQPDPYWSA